MAGDQFLRIAGITIALRAQQTPAWTWDGASARFVVPSADHVDVEITVRHAQPDPPSGELLFDSGAVWKMYRDGDGFRFDSQVDFYGPAPYRSAKFDATFTRGEITVHDPKLNPLEYPLDEILIAHLLGRGRGVELHSCGVVDRDGRGRIFAGVSGAGKTTTARLWEKAAREIVSDDRVIIREEDGAMWMHGTPWHGEAELSMPASAPLAAVYLLTQASTNEIREISAAEAVARLFRCTFPPFYDPTAIDFALQFLARVAAAVPVRELCFTRDESVVDLVLRGAGS